VPLYQSGTGTRTGSTLTFTSAPPTGTNNIYVAWTTPTGSITQIGTSVIEDGAVTFQKLNAAAVATQAEAEAGSVSNKLMTPLRVAQAIAALTPPPPEAVPSGAVMAFARNTAPTGWLKANGAAISRTTYANLFSAIGTTFGAGDGSTTFNLPDLRGEFIRGWDDGRGADSGRAFGSAQSDALQNLTGSFKTTRGVGGNNTGVFAGSTGGAATYSGPATGSYTTTCDFNAANSPGARTASETRPRNVALLACIKY
jgi:microcystin-dependent protein